MTNNLLLVEYIDGEILIVVLRHLCDPISHTLADVTFFLSTTGLEMEV